MYPSSLRCSAFSGSRVSVTGRQQGRLPRAERLVPFASVAHPGEELSRECSDPLPTSLSAPNTAMARGPGNLGSRGGGAVLEKSKLSMKQEVRTVEPKLDQDGGGGNNGKNIFNGGGGEGGDDDDDDYFNFDDGDGDGGSEGFFRTVLKQLYDENSIKAVLQEWFHTLGTLPFFIGQLVEMRRFSSAELYRVLSMDVRPNITRAVTRSLPPAIQRSVVGRLMADPAFAQKLFIEQFITLAASLTWEASQRRERFWQELDLVAINTLCLQAANASLVWLVSPNRSYGVVNKHAWQEVLHKLPNNVFDANSPLAQYTMSQRVGGFFAKVAELSAVGTLTGVAMSGLGNLDVQVRRKFDPTFTPSMPIPDVRASAGGMALALGLFSNARYQIIGGVDRYLFERSNFLWSYLSFSTLFRSVSAFVGEPTRRQLQGIRQRPRMPVGSRQFGQLPGLRSPHSPARSEGRVPSSSNINAGAGAPHGEATAATQPAAEAAPYASGEAGLKKAKRSKKKASRGFEMSIAHPSGRKA